MIELDKMKKEMRVYVGDLDGSQINERPESAELSFLVDDSDLERCSSQNWDQFATESDSSVTNKTIFLIFHFFVVINLCC